MHFHQLRDKNGGILMERFAVSAKIVLYYIKRYICLIFKHKLCRDTIRKNKGIYT